MQLFLSIIGVIISVLLTGASGYLYGNEPGDIIKIIILTGMGFLITAFGWFNTSLHKAAPYDNSGHPFRFFVICLSGLVFSCICPLFPKEGWPLLPFAAALLLFGNSALAFMAYSILVMIPVFLSGAAINVFFMYFIPGCCSIMLFSSIYEEGFKAGFPLFISNLLLFVSEMACSVIFLNERFNVNMLFIPLINVCICVFLNFLVLRFLNFRVIHREDMEHRDVADPEHSLMVWQKENSPMDYYHAIHTAYFAERIAINCGADPVLAKAGAYYQNIAKIVKERSGEDEETGAILHRICKDNNIPESIENVLKELNDKSFVSRESTFVMFSDAVVTSIKYLMDKHPGHIIDYSKVVDMIIQRKKENGSLKNSLIAINDMDIMRDVFIKEDLYYDFLRSDQ